MESLRLKIFFGVLVAMAIFEVFIPKRQRVQPRSKRWTCNLGMVVLNTVLIRLLLPFSVIQCASWAAEVQMGLFNQVQWPSWAIVAASVLSLDLIIYAQHVAFHRIPVLWRLHQIHHFDRDIDVTTGIRFHPLEIFISLAIKITAVLLLGIPAQAVLLFEIILNAAAMFNHSNIHLPQALDSILRLFVVTPDMHRVHHSTLTEETDSNFGFNIPHWDRIFGTYVAQPRLGHLKMEIGLHGYSGEYTARLVWLLGAPFFRHDTSSN